VTRHDDFHAHVVKKILEEQGLPCSLILADSLSVAGGLSWSSSWPAKGLQERGVIRDSQGDEVVIADLDVVWLRRLTGVAQIPVSLLTGTLDDSLQTTARQRCSG